MVEEKPKILLVYNHNRSFIQKDINILQKYFEVKTYFYKQDKNLFELRKLVRCCDIVYCWFASYHCVYPFLFANIYKKNKMVIVGGYDACNIKGYGIFSSWKGRRLAKYIYKNADKILVVDKSLKKDILANSKLNIADKIEVLPTGYDSNKWYPAVKKERIVLTVCFVDESNWWRKGINTFVKAAEMLPNISFYVVGKIDEGVKNRVENIPENVRFTGWVSDDELLQFYQKAKVYCQLSRYEGLPNVLCEAMLCECAPVGTCICGIPTAIGDTGFYVPYGDQKAITDAIEKALNAPDDFGEKARERIMNMFPINKRENEIVKIIEKIK